MTTLYESSRSFLNNNAFNIILVSILFSMVMIYNILADVKYSKSNSVLSRVMIIEDYSNSFSK